MRKVIYVAIVGVAIVFAFLHYSSWQSKRQAIEDIAAIPGSGWCENMDIAFDGQEYVNQGGWPCILVSGVTEVVVRDGNFCATVELEDEVGMPGENKYQKRWKSLCSGTEFGGWGFKDSIYEDLVKPNLRTLNESLCAEYSRVSAEFDWAALC
jgi:hypothetical protein